MSVRVPRAPRPANARAEVERMNGLRAQLLSKNQRGRRCDSASFAPLICAFAGIGLLFFVAAIILEVAPDSLFSQFVLMLCTKLPFGG